jgi:hypothetical protein
MSFIFYFLVGFISGVLGGMGMGGGTVLIPLLTIFLGVEQHCAQAANLIAFLPMAAFTLNVHKKSGYLKSEGLTAIITAAVISSLTAGAFAVFLPAKTLKNIFGIFLIALAVNRFARLFSK